MHFQFLRQIPNIAIFYFIALKRDINNIITHFQFNKVAFVSEISSIILSIMANLFILLYIEIPSLLIVYLIIHFVFLIR